jgi:prolipoprotein diacylglyceryltransferase
VGFIAAAFAFWRKAKEEHYHEEQVFDAFLLSSLVGLIAGRLGFVILHAAEFAAQPWRVFDMINSSGGNLVCGLIGASLYLNYYAKRKKWDAFEVLDFWFMALALGMVFVQLGNFLAGVGFGNETVLPWGMVFPGVFTKHHPAQLYALIFFVILYVYLQKVEYHYRTFMWYRAGKKTAQTGFLASVFLLATGIFMSLLQLIMPSQFMVNGISADLAFSVLMAVYGALLLYTRSGRSLAFWRRKETGLFPNGQ